MGSQSEMEANDPPNGWIPYMTSKDCTQGICSLYCPQWCYLAFPPPPPDLLGDDDGVDPPSALSISPLIIAIIGVLASAFLLVTYYTVISKFCSTSRANADDIPREANNATAADGANDPWYAPNATGGLDEAFIKTITLCKYKKGSGMVEGTCSVCLSEFEDDESIRLLPRCTHAFHVTCIDTWLKSHSNCPLCRSEVAFTGSFPVMMPQPTPAVQSPHNENRQQLVHNSPTDPNGDTRDCEEATATRDRPSKSKSVRMDRGSHRDDIVPTGSLVINVVQELQPIRRSFSTGNSCPTVADILKEDQDEQNKHIQGEMESTSISTATASNHHALDISFLQHYAMDDRTPDPDAHVKRSLSSDRLSLSQGRAKGAWIPL